MYALMNFFRLHHPKYTSDEEWNDKNPVEIEFTHRMPAVSCKQCGRWVSSKVLRNDLTDLPVEYLKILSTSDTTLPVAEWEKFKNEVAFYLEVEPDKLSPGTKLGTPKGKIFDEFQDFTYPYPGLIWVKQKVADVLREMEATGLTYNKVNIINKSNLNNLPDLIELGIKGLAWRKNSTYEKIVKCDICNRTHFPNSSFLKIDESRWNSSDFFNPDLNPFIVMVTQRICEEFSKHQFSNWNCIPASKS